MFQGQPYTPANVSTVLENSAAAKAGIQPGDHVLSIDGTTVNRFEDIKRIIALNAGATVPVEVDRSVAGQPFGIGDLRVPERFVAKDPAAPVDHAELKARHILIGRDQRMFAEADARLLFDDDEAVIDVAAAAAEFGRHLRAEKTGLPRLEPQLARRAPRRLGGLPVQCRSCDCPLLQS